MATEQGNAAIAQMYAEDFGSPEPGVEAEETPIAEPEGAVDASQETQHEAPPETPEVELEPEIPPDIQALLDEPDFDEEDEPEPPVENDPEDEFAFDDEASEALRKKNKALEKKLKWMEEQRVKSESKNWQAEAEKYFPLSTEFADKIEATSRRAFLRQARDYHDRALKAANKTGTVKAPASDEAAIEARVRAEMEAAWGKPVVGPGKAPVEAAELQKKLDSTRDPLERQKIRGTTAKIWGDITGAHNRAQRG